MFRNLMGAVAALGGLALIGLGLTGLGSPAGWQIMALGAAIVAAVVFERARYKRAGARPEANFQPTAERFIDPTTRQPVTVYVDPATGERKYVKD